MRHLFSALFLMLFCGSNYGQNADHSHADLRNIDFPDIPGYVTLVCDFHQHTVFSDGSVWPNIRVQEANKDGLDAISITEHLEYQPHKNDIPHPDRNRSYEIAKQAAKGSDLLVISGSEITRSLPPGHSNAIFIKDSNKLLKEDAKAVFEEANAQGAFVFWNHPNWISQQKNGIATLSAMHSDLLANKLLHGIEVVNEDTYSDEALQLALDYNLTIMGTSDIHGLIDWQFNVPHGHRPVTLVLAKERSEAGIKEALFAGRTLVYFNNLLIGKEVHLLAMLSASLVIESANYIGDSQVLAVEIRNNSDVDFLLMNNSGYTLHRNSDVFEVAANGTTTIQVKTLENLSQVELVFEVLNAVKAPNQHPEMRFKTMNQ